MFFVLAQHREHGRTFENNVRIGGYKNRPTAEARALRDDRPMIVRDHSRNIVMMTNDHKVTFKT